MYDDFDRPDGPIGGSWIDLYDLQHTWAEGDGVGSGMLSRGSIVDGVATFRARTDNAHDVSGGNPWAVHLQVGHFMLYQQLGVDTDMEVSVEWLCDEGGSVLSQVSPMAFVDPAASDPLLMGLLPIWDISLSAMYIQNAFRCPEPETFSPAYYRLLGSDGRLHAPLDRDEAGPPPPGSGVGRAAPTAGPGQAHLMSLRAAAGQIAMYFDGDRVVGPHPVPDEFRGRDGWGIHVIAIQLNPTHGLTSDDGPSDGSDSPSPRIVVDHDVPARVGSWRARDFTGDWDDPFD